MFNRTRLLRMALGVTLGWASITLNAQTVNKTFSNQTLKTVLKEVETQTGMSIVYKTDEVNVDKKVSAKFTDASIDDVLSKVLDKSLTWHIQDKMIVITKRQKSSVSDKKITVTGKVLDSQNMPIIGASVVVKGTSNGTISDFDGNFSFTAPENSLIEVSYIGYKSQQLTAVDGRTLSIIMKEDTEVLDEVVVVGFGTQKKVNLTGAVGTVDSEVFSSRPVSNVSEMLQGTVPGLNITGGDGTSMNSAASKINVRGMTTIGEGSSGNPLILIDGMEGDLNSVNPQDIENISVLKDAASSSIYGSRAPFGVILITTKSGSAGKMSVNYNNNFRWSSPLDLPTPMDSYSFALYFRDAGANGGAASTLFSPDRIDLIKRYQQGEDLTPSAISPDDPNRWGDGIGYGNANTNHYKELFRNNVFSQEHNLSIKGGNEKINYYVSANYSNDKGFFTYNQETRDRITTTSKISAKLTDWLRLKVTNRFTTQNYQEPIGKTSYEQFWRRLATWPCAPAYDANGNLFEGSPVFWVANEGTSDAREKWFYQQYQLELEPIKGWKTFIDFNYKHYNIEKTNVKDVSYSMGVDNKTKYLAKGASNDSYVEELRNSNNYLNLNVYTQYLMNLQNSHNINLMAGFQIEKEKLGNLSVERKGLLMDSSNSLDVTSGLSYEGLPVPPEVMGKYNEWSTAGFFARVNYDYKSRYLLEANLRYDGTSRFRSDSRWGVFPSGSIGWNIARESFFEEFTDKISNLKIRASYGVLGNQNTNNFYPTYRVVPFQSASGAWLINGNKPSISSEPGLVYSGLTWEKIKSWNLGLEVSAFNNRFNMSFDYYIRDTEDMVGPAPELPSTFGFTVPKMNNTDLRTTGFELILSWRDVLKNDFSYGITATLSDSRTKIISYPNDTRSLSNYISGQYVGEIWGYETIGIAKTDEEMKEHLASLPNGGQNKLGSKWSAGDIMYKDINNDGKIDNGKNTLDDHGDLKVIGNNMPRYLLGLTLDAAWKGFDIRAFFQGTLKRDYFLDNKGNNDRMMWGACAGIYNSVGLVEHLDYFRDDPNHELGVNIDSYYPRPLFNTSRKNQQVQTRYLMNAAYLRLKNLQFGYTLPASITNKVGISKFRVYLSGENLFTITGLSDMFDPETIDLGVGGITYPLSRTWSIGLNIIF